MWWANGGTGDSGESGNFGEAGDPGDSGEFGDSDFFWWMWWFWWFVSLYVITSTFPLWRLQIIPESYQTQHIIYHWKKDDITDDNDSDTQLYFHCRKNLRSWLLQDPALHSAATLCTLCSLSNHSKVLALCFFYHANLTVFRSMLTNRKKITTFMELNK